MGFFNEKYDYFCGFSKEFFIVQKKGVLLWDF